jgi:hypothetical protein
MNAHVQILIKLIFYVFTRYQAGYKMSPREKSQMLNGLYVLAVDFFSRYISNESELGAKWMEVSPRNNICLSDEPHVEDEKEISTVFQDTQVCSSVPRLQSRIRKKCKVAEYETHDE